MKDENLMNDTIALVKDLYRIIIEKSIMNNNDEYVFYSSVLDDKNIFLQTVKGPFDNPMVVLERPVYQIEIDQGLQINKNSISCLHEEIPTITRQIDALYKIKSRIEFQKEHGISQPSKFIASYLGTFFYDCMSCGMPKWELALIKFFAQQENIDKTTIVYPRHGTEKWITIEDFLHETEKMNIPKIETECKILALLYIG